MTLQNSCTRINNMHTLLVWAYQRNAQNPHPNVTIRVHIIEIVVQTVQQFSVVFLNAYNFTLEVRE